jgi:hypothetical protein
MIIGYKIMWGWLYVSGLLKALFVFNYGQSLISMQQLRAS